MCALLSAVPAPEERGAPETLSTIGGAVSDSLSFGVLGLVDVGAGVGMGKRNVKSGWRGS